MQARFDHNLPRRAECVPLPLRTAVGIASAGRPATLQQTIRYLATIQAHPVRTIVCVPDIDDAGSLSNSLGVELIVGPRGLTCQRNAIIRAAARGTDIIVFLDDDFVPAPDFVARMAAVFARQQDVVIATGEVLADGILGSGLSMAEALSIIESAGERPELVTDVYNAYGCNMVVRLAPVLERTLTFDEELPLYGWLEDVDFSRTIARHGRSVKVAGALGVHLGVKSGRQPGLRLGYSQVANPAYLMRKGTMASSRAIAQISRNMLANLRGVLLADRTVDRLGRLRGNIVAVKDLLAGNSSPSRILEFSGSSTKPMPPTPANRS
ncbi:glycosyltransferase [Ensifer sp. MPMI2T]|nr:glycosyltransferase [Ensifer sp. MPMI2T]